MIFISHRGNLNGPNPKNENSPSYIEEALSLFDVEIDVWYINNSFYLGHDNPLYQISSDFLLNRNLWCHAKNIEALYMMIELKVSNCFWHQNDECTLTSNGYIWTYPGFKLTDKSIAVMPEVAHDKVGIRICAGICSDFIQSIAKFNEKK